MKLDIDGPQKSITFGIFMTFLNHHHIAISTHAWDIAPCNRLMCHGRAARPLRKTKSSMCCCFIYSLFTWRGLINMVASRNHVRGFGTFSSVCGRWMDQHTNTDYKQSGSLPWWLITICRPQDRAVFNLAVVADSPALRTTKSNVQTDQPGVTSVFGCVCALLSLYVWVCVCLC